MSDLAYIQRNIDLIRRLREYIRENTHPECLPEMRFAVTLPDGTSKYFSTYSEASKYLGM